ncbi:MAG: MinD/ParA family protein [Gammaproteobacteria bacterium]|nr:MAG: MinD/ParA family protein [Gammaproteobacteria bacterium]
MSTYKEDQASGLRRLSGTHGVRVIAVTSGKGGVGKTHVTVNLACVLAREAQSVMLLDADMGLANVDVLLGLHTPYNLHHVIEGERTLEEVLVEGPFGIKVVPAASGVQKMAQLGPMEHAGLIAAFSTLIDPVDVLLIDTAAGIADGVVTYACAAQEVLVVVCDEPASITDAYALIKLLSRDHGVQRFRILANMVQGAAQGMELFGKLHRVAERFLDVNLDYIGAIPYDDHVRQAVQKQRAVVEMFPGSRVSRAFRRLGEKVQQFPYPQGARGGLEFFLDRLCV